MQYRLTRALRYATIALFVATGLDALEHLFVNIAIWQPHVAAISACTGIVFLLASVGFPPRERSEPLQFSETDQHLHSIRGRAQDALAESESRYRWLFENMLEGCAYCKMQFDDRGSPMDFVYLDVNGAFGKLTGLRNVVGKRFTEVIPDGKDSHPELLEIYGRVVLTGQPESFQIEIKALGMWFSISAHAAGKECFVATFDNITERKQMEQELRQAEEKYRAIFQGAVVGIFQSTPGGRYVNVNPAMANMLGYDSPQELVETITDISQQVYVDPQNREELTRLLKEQGMVKNFECAVHRKDGSKMWFSANVRAVFEDGVLVGHEGTNEDITARKVAEERIQFLAFYDALTGLPNRTLLHDRLGKALAGARRQKRKIALLFLDLDGFKLINDSLGHSVGDLLLQEVAERLKTWGREQDTVARLGGDEFLINADRRKGRARRGGCRRKAHGCHDR